MKFIKIDHLVNQSKVAVISLNRPEVRNAFHPEMIREITETFKDLSIQKDIHLAVLKGEGLHFCSGADLNWMKEMVKYTYEQNIQDSEKLWDMFESITNCPIPIIGVLQGAVFGGALGLAACCDYVIADEKTSFCFSEVKLGLAPAVISSFILRKTSETYARSLMLSAEVFDTDKALRMGLIHKTMSQIDQWPVEMNKFLLNGPQAMIETKKLLNQLTNGLSWLEQKKLTTKVISERRLSTEGQERLQHFFKK